MTEIATRSPAWQDIVPLPVVVDADVLSRSVDHALKMGYEPAVVRHASASYTNFTGITVFAIERVVDQTFRRFAVIAKARGVTVADVERVWDAVFCARVRVVDMATVPVDDPRIDDVAGRDPDDAPTAKLAVLLAPCALLTDNWPHWRSVQRSLTRHERSMRRLRTHSMSETSASSCRCSTRAHCHRDSQGSQSSKAVRRWCAGSDATSRLL